jgi:hypothetical protein
MNYYVTPIEVLQNISNLICENMLDNYLSKEDLMKLKNLNVGHIHNNTGNVIDEYERLFEKANQKLELTLGVNTVTSIIICGEQEESSFDLMNMLYEIIESLKNRKDAIRNITMDVLKKREECCCYY